jgi:hypothetical protein
LYAWTDDLWQPLAYVALWRGQVFGFILAGFTQGGNRPRPTAFLSTIEQQVHAEIQKRENALAAKHGSDKGPGSYRCQTRKLSHDEPEIEYLHIDTKWLVGSPNFHDYLTNIALLRFLHEALLRYPGWPVHTFCHGESNNASLLLQHYFVVEATDNDSALVKLRTVERYRFPNTILLAISGEALKKHHIGWSLTSLYIPPQDFRLLPAAVLSRL